MVSSVTGALISQEELSKPEYWVQNLVSPVLFSDALTTLCTPSLGNKTKKINRSHRRLTHISELVEIGPHSALQGPCGEILRSTQQNKSIGYMSILARKVSAVHTALDVAGRLHCLGYPINLQRVNSGVTEKQAGYKALTTLPGYSFNHSKTYWHESRISKNYRFREVARNDLLGVPDSDWNSLEAKWRNIIRTEDVPWIGEHVVRLCFPK
jgi:acyl transferase domain-containing protein